MTALLLRPEGAPAPELPTLLKVPGDALWSTLGPETLGAPALEIAFQSFKDGRGFTLARELRDRLGYQGWLRASGDLLPDQATHLRDVGFDDVLVGDNGALPAWERAANRFKRRLQRIAAGAPQRGEAPRSTSVENLNDRFAALSTEALFEESLRERWPGSIAVLSSFGAEAAVTLHLAAQVDRFTPVLFLDTGKLFPETLAYQKALVQRLGLGNVRVIKPAPAALAAVDPQGDLWTRDCNACCTLRKVEPLTPEAEAFSVLITGRKRVHGDDRERLPILEQQGTQLRLNPLAPGAKRRWKRTSSALTCPATPFGPRGTAPSAVPPARPPQAPPGPARGAGQGWGKRSAGSTDPRWLR